MYSYKKTTALLFATLVLAAQANVAVQAKLAKEFEIESHQPAPIDRQTTHEFEFEARKPASTEIQTRADGWGISADVNEYVDSTIHMIVPFMQRHGLDPMPLPEVVEGFSVRYFLITYSAWLKIHDGSMTGLSKVERSGDQMVHYFAKMLRVRIALNFQDLEFVYKYLVQVMNIGPTGGISATLDRYVVAVDVLIDFNNDEVHLQEFSISEIGRLRVRFTISVLVDWLLNPVLNLFVQIFDNVIIKVVELTIFTAVNLVIRFINSNIRTVIDAIESLN